MNDGEADDSENDSDEKQKRTSGQTSWRQRSRKEKTGAVSVLNLAISGWSKKDSPRKLLGERKLIGSKQQ